MNLIEQLGGYEKAKEYLKENSCFMSFGALEGFYDALLDYRRKHNIYELGDKVVYNSKYMTNEIRIVEEYWKGCIGAIYRHATDAEIQAGKRL